VACAPGAANKDISDSTRGAGPNRRGQAMFLSELDVDRDQDKTAKEC
jgi:hypothetical protein